MGWSWGGGVGSGDCDPRLGSPSWCVDTLLLVGQDRLAFLIADCPVE